VKIVCDTTVLVSGVLYQGPPRRAMTMAARGEVVNCISPDLLREVEDVLLRRKFGLRPDQVAAMVALFRDSFEIVHPARRVVAVAVDPADDRVLEAAIAAGAEAILSGDRHLLDLGEFAGVRILTPARFVAGSRGGTGTR
jgi:putative PIN family toxin of toxin-antitoxin system